MGSPEGSDSCWHLFPVLVEPAQRHEFLDRLKSCGIGAAIHYPIAIPDQPAMRLLQAERLDEIYPILLEEIVNLGHQRALVMMADFETGAIAPVAAIACPEEFIDGFNH